MIASWSLSLILMLNVAVVQGTVFRLARGVLGRERLHQVCTADLARRSGA